MHNDLPPAEIWGIVPQGEVHEDHVLPGGSLLGSLHMVECE